MKIEVNSAQWCPDNCRCFSEDRTIMYGDGIEMIRAFSCANAGICANAVLNYQKWQENLGRCKTDPCTK